MSSFFKNNYSSSQREPIPEMRSPELPPHIQRPKGLHTSLLPCSPTDSIMSPCSKRIWGAKKMIKPDKFDLNLLNPETQVIPMSFPIEDNDLIFASSSKFRKVIIDLLGWNYTQISPDIDEKAIRCDDPMDLPILIAEAKAQAIVDKLTEEGDESPKIIITADQIVLFENNIREKPIDKEQAISFLSSYSGKSVSTVSAIVITHYPSGLQSSGVDVANIEWASISDEVVKKVVEKKEIFSCAGGFKIEDPDLTPLVKSLNGTIDSVLGFPISLTLRLLEDINSYLEEPPNLHSKTFSF